MKSLVKLFLLACLAVLLVGVLEGAVLSERIALAMFGVRAEATVIRKEPFNHQEITYEYEIEGRRYTLVGTAGVSAPPFNQVQLGDQITITYLPERPEVSAIGSPEQKLTGHLVSAAVGTLLLLVGLVVLVHPALRQLRRRINPLVRW